MQVYLISLHLALLMTLVGVSSGAYNERKLAPRSKDVVGNRPCPCSDPSLCNPITKVASREGFVFATSNLNYKKYDWSKISTLAAFGSAVNDSLMCYAHSKGARLSYGVDFPVGNLTNPDARAQWVSQQVQFAKDHFMDGVNLDFESAIAENDTKTREGLNSLVQELTTAFKAAFENPQVTFDTPSSPISGRHYDYAFIANTMDFIFIMAYDESGSCRAGANSGYNVTALGVQQFLKLGIPAKKLVLGLPWYGYDYPCSSIDKDNKCTLYPHCGGVQATYDTTYRIYFKSNTSSLIWDEESSTPYFNHKNPSTGQLRQAWCDNVQSLIIKYIYAYQNGLRGIGLWHADTLLYDDSDEGQKQRKIMWGALPSV